MFGVGGANIEALITGAVLAGLWALLVRPAWALLAIGIHLLGDRALFGNSLKPVRIPFEPTTAPDFAAFECAYHGRVLARGGDPARELADVHRG